MLTVGEKYRSHVEEKQQTFLYPLCIINFNEVDGMLSMAVVLYLRLH